MRPPWKHLLAALAVVAGLGLNACLAGASDPSAKLGPGAAQDKTPPARKPNADLTQLRQAGQQTADQLQQLTLERDRLQERERVYAAALTASDPRLAKLRDQLEAAQKAVADAEARKAKAEEELRAAETTLAEAESPHLRVFHLEHQDALEMESVLTMLFPGRAQFAGTGRGMSAGAMRGMAGGAAGPRGAAVAAPGGDAFGRFGGPGGFAARVLSPSRLRLAADQRTRCVIARGSEQDLATAADLIAMLDRDAGKPSPRLKDVRVFPLHHARAEDVIAMLQGLGIEARVAAVSSPRMLVAFGQEPALKEVGEVLDAVDVPTPAPKPGKVGGKH